jgi:hypothetical protein
MTRGWQPRFTKSAVLGAIAVAGSLLTGLTQPHVQTREAWWS